MLHFSKLTQTALAVMCQLGEAYGSHRMTSFTIADASHLPRPIVAKVLTVLARSGLICGARGRGPGGGFQLARPPDQITLWDIVGVFDKRHFTMGEECPLGVQGCHHQRPCSLHVQHLLLQSQLHQLLHEFNLVSLTASSGSRSSWFNCKRRTQFSLVLRPGDSDFLAWQISYQPVNRSCPVLSASGSVFETTLPRGGPRGPRFQPPDRRRGRSSVPPCLGRPC